MSRTPASYLQADLTRALKAVRAAGMDLARDRLRITVNRNGAVIEGKTAEPPPEPDNDGKDIVL